MAPNPQSPDSTPIIGEVPAESLFLSEDLQTLCYQGAHMRLVILVCFLFVFYTVALPLVCFILLMREFWEPSTSGLLGWIGRNSKWLRGKRHRHKTHAELQRPPTPKLPRRSLQSDSRKKLVSTYSTDSCADKLKSAAHPPATQMATLSPQSQSSSRRISHVVPDDPESPRSNHRKLISFVSDAPKEIPAVPQRVKEARQDTYGFLFLNFRDSHYAGIVGIFVLHVGFAAVNELISTSSIILKLFLSGILMALQTIVIAIELPFVKWQDNLRRVLIGLASIVSSHSAHMETDHRNVPRLSTNVLSSVCCVMFSCADPQCVATSSSNRRISIRFLLSALRDILRGITHIRFPRVSPM